MPVALFFALTYLLSWSCFGLAIALSPASSATNAAATGLTPIVTTLGLVGTFAPSLVAIALTARFHGREGLSKLLNRVLEFPSSLRWYLFALGYILAIKLGAAVGARILTGTWPAFGSMPWWSLPFSIAISMPVQAGEEIGWRGFALPRLEGRMHLAWAALLLGVFWEVWHLPLFFVPGLGHYGQSFPVFALGGIALSVAMAWLYAHTNRSIGMAMLMHSAVNQTIGVVPTANPVPANPFLLETTEVGWTTLALLWISAAYFLWRMPATASSPATISPSPVGELASTSQSRPS